MKRKRPGGAVDFISGRLVIAATWRALELSFPRVLSLELGGARQSEAAGARRTPNNRKGKSTNRESLRKVDAPVVNGSIARVFEFSGSLRRVASPRGTSEYPPCHGIGVHPRRSGICYHR